MEELEKEVSANLKLGVETESSSNTQTEQQLDSLPRLEDLLKSEKEVKVAQKIEGLEKATESIEIEDKVFTRKVDEKKVYLKKRLKIISAVYITVVALMLTLVGINVATLISMNNTINNNTITIVKNESDIQNAQNQYNATTPTGQEITVSLNEPRDYSDDTKELTFLDKMTILFRNMFG